MYDIQSRWKLEGNVLRYYGLRNQPDMFKNTVKLTKKQKAIVKKLPCELTDDEISVLKNLIGVQIVKFENKRAIPSSFHEARFCKTCIANDFMIPGIEFDTEGRCPICQSVDKTKNLKSIVPIMNTFPRSKKSRFDVAVFYTGGKDSTYLLYYLSKVLNLRVLALTWEIPYMSECAKKSIENAKQSLDSVEFISRKVSNEDLRKIYNKLYALSGNTCACPSLAYVLFYPELVANKVSYFVAGNEPAQLLGLYFNHMAPKIAYTFPDNKSLNFLLNIGRLLTLHPPLKKGQFHTLATMKQLAYGDSKLKNMAGYSNQLVYNVCEAIKEVPNILNPLKKAIRSSSWSGNIPAFVQVDFDEICGGVYEWRKIKDIINSECGWVAPEEVNKGLHTSCKIEKCKEHSQFARFYHMRSTMIPFSALEIAIASRSNNLSREDALAELKASLGFSLEEIPECAIMREYIEQ
ncbi:MAG: hypothetical protein KIG20_01765 [Eubacteriales bacterium]|nr:hypothetical protein [Eubacteriales bacterium]MCI7094504.1 hypothetical protein [Clostridiales bacterium]